MTLEQLTALVELGLLVVVITVIVWRRQGDLTQIGIGMVRFSRPDNDTSDGVGVEQPDGELR